MAIRSRGISSVVAVVMTLALGALLKFDYDTADFSLLGQPVGIARQNRGPWKQSLEVGRS